MSDAGSEPAEPNRMTTFTDLTAELRALQSTPPAVLADRYTALFGKPPRSRNAAWLRRQVAWRMQADAFGGLSDRARQRLDELAATIDLPIVAAAPPPKPHRVAVEPRSDSGMPAVGTVLTRPYRGETLQVAVRENGFEWNGAIYTSLSAVAKAITGSAWNGKLFFGLTERKKAQ